MPLTKKFWEDAQAYFQVTHKDILEYRVKRRGLRIGANLDPKDIPKGLTLIENLNLEFHTKTSHACCGVVELAQLSGYAVREKVGEPGQLPKILTGILLYLMFQTNRGHVVYFCPNLKGTWLGNALESYGFTFRGDPWYNPNTGNMVEEMTVDFGKNYGIE